MTLRDGAVRIDTRADVERLAGTPRLRVAVVGRSSRAVVWGLLFEIVAKCDDMGLLAYAKRSNGAEHVQLINGTTFYAVHHPSGLRGFLWDSVLTVDGGHPDLEEVTAALATSDYARAVYPSPVCHHADGTEHFLTRGADGLYGCDET